MSIRLNKALRELNIGLQTAVEFLEKKSELGEVKSEPSFKLNDAQYKALAEAFRKDAEVRDKADKLFQKKPKEKKREQEPKGNRAEDYLKSSTQQHYKPLGKIDLDNLGRKPQAQNSAAPKEKDAPKPEAAAVSREKETTAPVQVETPKKVEPVKEEPKAEPVAKTEPKAAPVGETPAPQVKAQPEPAKPEPVKAEVAAKPVPQSEAPKPAPKAVEPSPKAVEPAKVNVKPVAQQTAPKPAAQEVKPAEPVKEAEADKKTTKPEVFQLKSEKKILNAPKVNVLGKIDLDALNQSTRPKKKSKEERRKEREEKGNGHGERKKRVRINKERVDINAAVNSQQNNNNNNNQQNRNGNSKKKKNRNRNQRPLEVNEEDVARQVKETLARLTSKQNFNKKGAKYRKEKREAVQEKLNEEARAEKKESKVLKLTEFVTVSELATMMNVSVTQVISTLMSIGVMASINQRLDAETINMVAEEFGFKTEYVSAEVQEAVSEEADDENDLVPRAPIVTVMGHVDHGKTSLLDYIRKTNVIAGEAGGITQHIGAYNVKLEDGRHITFLDTPGHEAFTAMRARGAQVTDIAIIIIAADDSVMPTTREAIAHCQAAGVPMVFAINKIDKPGANPDKIREDLANMNLLVDEWGGKYQCQEGSWRKRTP